MKRFFFILAFLSVVAISATAQDTSQQRSKKARLEKEIRMLEEQLKENSSQNANALSTLAILEKKISARKELVQESDRELAEIGDSIAVCRREIDKVRSRLDTLTLYYDRLVKNAYKNRDSRVWYMYILASQNLGQASRRFGYLKNLSGQMNRQASLIKEAKARLEERLSEMNTLKRKAQALKDSRVAELKSLQEEESQSRALIAQLQKDKTRYTQQLNSKRQQVEALNREIEKIINASMNGGGKKKSGKPVDYKLSEEFASNMGKLPWPAQGPVMEHFGRHNHPVYTNLAMPFNNGINIGLSRGAKAYAVFGGEVKKIIVMPGYNKCVLVQHGGYFTFYCKLSSVSVKAGQKVALGEEIGVVDTMDGQTQLHFQLWEGNKPQDPELWLRPQ